VSHLLYEPPLVRLLRSCLRRGAPLSLLARVAGGEHHWRQLNNWWGIDGRPRVRDEDLDASL
jgi:hypothetical protein